MRWREDLRSQWVKDDDMDKVLSALTPENRLVMEVALVTGLRVSDVLGLRTNQLRTRDGKPRQRITVQEQKTGKNRQIYLPGWLWASLDDAAGKKWVFPGRLDGNTHRSRQAVWKDVKRAAKAFRLEANVTPHSARKVWAVGELDATGSLEAVQKKLNHTDPAVTLIYAMADRLPKSGPWMKRKSRL